MSEKYTVEGVIKAKRKDGKGISINDVWYSTYYPSDLNHVDKGDKVSFSAADNGNWHNIKSKVEVQEKDQGSTQGGGNGGSGNGGGGNNYRKHGDKGGFPIHPQAYERTLDRRSAVASAVEVFKRTVSNEAKAKLPSPHEYDDPSQWSEELAQPIIDLARKFEAYTCGDLDREALKEITGETSGNGE